ncbi:hypothetical protein CYMTET_31043 [Cymbomonas tetramitiformis]|uniref:Uncharacterized protein n=1 Tax=Cymbomonas tetramitiformis TaxID=36881 RepID=A0AAE0KTL0_9CHLO|nr:hypothetical protein CYMTET_31043 [Cymbomonas tetramitiformis]
MARNEIQTEFAPMLDPASWGYAGTQLSELLTADTDSVSLTLPTSASPPSGHTKPLLMPADPSPFTAGPLAPLDLPALPAAVPPRQFPPPSPVKVVPLLDPAVTPPQARTPPSGAASILGPATCLGTALVLAHLRVARALPVAQLELQVARAAELFARHRGADAEPGFLTQYHRLTSLLLDNLQRSGWSSRAAVWRAMQAQRVDGAWAASEATACVLLPGYPYSPSDLPQGSAHLEGSAGLSRLAVLCASAPESFAGSPETEGARAPWKG